MAFQLDYGFCSKSAINDAVTPVDPIPKLAPIVDTPVPWIATCTASVVFGVKTPDSVNTEITAIALSYTHLTLPTTPNV